MIFYVDLAQKIDFPRVIHCQRNIVAQLIAESELELSRTNILISQSFREGS